MSSRLSAAAEIMGHYAAGYFPLYDTDDRFYWERLPIRAVVPLTGETVAMARELGRRPRRKFVIRYNMALDEVISVLQNPRVKPRTWVRREVVELYRTLQAAGLLRTVEAYDRQTNQLAGGLLGIAFPGTFIAETMFSLQSDASKVCLCDLVERASAVGYRLIDVQTPHDLEFLRRCGADPVGPTPHPCIRLGEQTLPLPLFMQLFRAAASTAFPGNMGDWLAIAGRLTAGADFTGLDPQQVDAAVRMIEFAPMERTGDTLKRELRALFRGGFFRGGLALRL